MLRLVITGLALGVLTSVPIGVANLAVVDGARRLGLRRGLGVAFGGALADGVHAGLACAGIAPLVAAHTGIELALSLVAAGVLGGYGIALVRASGAGAVEEEEERAARGSLIGGVGVGLALTLSNPAALAAWVVVAGALFPGVTVAGGAVVAAGVAIGAAAWFVLLAVVADRGGRVYGARSAWLSRGAGLVMVGLGAWFAYRALRLTAALW